MANPKPLGSLSSTLLARKGHARPAMRPQGYGFVGLAPQHDDLGWNDMGDPHEAAAEAEVPQVLVEREALKEEIEAPAPVRETVAVTPLRAERIRRETKAKGAKAAFTLRLDDERHLRLRLASAVCNRSSQQIVTEALEMFLATLPEVDALVDQLSAKKR